MIIRSIDEAGDWNFGKGKNDYVSQNEAVAQDITCRLRSFLGDCFFAIDEGIDWFNLLGAKSQIALELAIKNTIANTQFVVTVDELSVSLSPRTRALNLVFSVTTVFPGSLRKSLGFLTTEDGDILTTEDGDRLEL